MRRENGTIILMVVIAVIVIFTVLFMSFQIVRRVFGFNPPSVSAETQADSIDILTIVNNSKVYVDTEVVVNGKIDSWVSKRAFTLGVQQGLLNKRQLLIVQKTLFLPPQRTKSGELSLGESRDVIVKGKVKIFDRPSLERALRVDLLPAEYDSWNGQPFIIAETITVP